MSTTATAIVIKTEPRRIDYVLQQGDGWAPETMTAYLGGTVVNGEVVGGTLIDFTGYTATMPIYKAVRDGSEITTLDNGTHGGVVLSSEGEIDLSMTGAQTAALEPGVYNYYLRLTPDGGEPRKYTFGTITVVDDMPQDP